MAIELRTTRQCKSLDLSYDPDLTRTALLAQLSQYTWIEELNLEGSQISWDASIGAAISQLPRLKVLKLAGSHFTHAAVFDWVAREPRSFRIEMWDHHGLNGILTRALLEGEVSSRLTHQETDPTTNRDWRAVHALTTSGSWSPKELQLLITLYTSNHPRFIAWRRLTTELTPSQQNHSS